MQPLAMSVLFRKNVGPLCAYTYTDVLISWIIFSRIFYSIVLYEPSALSDLLDEMQQPDKYDKWRIAVLFFSACCNTSM